MGQPIRLEREMSVAGQAGCATTIGIFLAVIGIVMVIVMQSEEPSAGKNQWVLYAVGGGFALVGVLMVVLGIKMFLMTRIPETIVEVDKMPVRVGASFQLTVRQPGPIRLRSLRANLVCEQITTRKMWRAGKTKTDRDRRLIYQANVFDLRDAAVSHGEQIVRHATVNVPADVKLADIEGNKAIIWRVEVWGRVRGWADFGHPYVIEVLDKRDRNDT
jgi:hypothetical protein